MSSTDLGQYSDWEIWLSHKYALDILNGKLAYFDYAVAADRELYDNAIQRLNDPKVNEFSVELARCIDELNEERARLTRNSEITTKERYDTLTTDQIKQQWQYIVDNEEAWNPKIKRIVTANLYLKEVYEVEMQKHVPKTRPGRS
jgi:hypothetical protein